MTHVIGLDIGTSGIKVSAMDREGRLEFPTYESYSLSYPRKLWVEVDVEKLWVKVEKLLMKVWNRVNDVGRVDAISLSTFCNSTVFLDKKGKALSNAIMYLDQRSIPETEKIRSTITEEKIFRITKNRLEPGMHTITTYEWFRKNKVELYSEAYKWGNVSTYLLYKLTGEFVMDWTQASFSGMFDVTTYKWSKEICEEIGVDVDLLPRVVDPCTIVGNLEDKYINGRTIPVFAGAADTACSTLAMGIKPNEIFESVGTSDVLTICTTNPNQMDKRFLNRCHIIKNQWLSHGAMSFPGASIQWFYDQFLKDDGHSKDVLERLPKESPIGSNGVFFLPYMQGERSPIWDPHATGVFIGLSLNTSKADMLRAILEGAALGLKQNYKIMLENYNPVSANMKTIGGGAKNREWAKIKSNALGISFEIQEITETAVLGACMIAGVGVGYYKTFEEMLSNIPNKSIETISPSSEIQIQYEELSSIYNELYPSLKSFFKSSQSRAHSGKGEDLHEKKSIYHKENA